ncbi:hypothetical protein P872_07560 [Rhodonellum psychrophilum GCM71 = DSM 17998]|uniref:Uncharacterized protein n=1 Tax=Rhodonellum psychrophilum GCM71 = DSM 17998 TaxID=1123057 RepID=U5BVW2_9BACT|nr:hypothetical protein P872_07560 [Rhodonellum psychrophilum GCM71 = DSM 17998]
MHWVSYWGLKMQENPAVWRAMQITDLGKSTNTNN